MCAARSTSPGPDGRGGCAWVHGEPAGRDTVFCGKPTVDRVWCAEHRAVVYRNPAPVGAPADADDGADDLDALAGAAE